MCSSLYQLKNPFLNPECLSSLFPFPDEFWKSFMDFFNVFSSQSHVRPLECCFSSHHSTKTVPSRINNDLYDTKSSTTFKILTVFDMKTAFATDVYFFLLETFVFLMFMTSIHILSFSSSPLKSVPRFLLYFYPSVKC